LAIYLRDRGWDVTVYCQHQGTNSSYEDEWKGIHRVNLFAAGDGPASTIVFDWKAIRHAVANPRGIALTLGYNTAIFNAKLRSAGIPNVFNMDGIEWNRAKWGVIARTWFWLNEGAGCLLGTHLIADHPEIKRHLNKRVTEEKITVIPYGADAITFADEAPVRQLGLTPGHYVTVIARPEPENSLLEIVKGFSSKARGLKLVVLGQYNTANRYHVQVKQAASTEVKFVGAIYDKDSIGALRFHSLLYVHGHQVGGTNPSLVEALGAGNAVLAHDNRFNRWVAGNSAAYFSDAYQCETVLDALLSDLPRIDAMRQASRKRHAQQFTWPKILKQYEDILLMYTDLI
jgi:glycosyltransferase involved in cell wall biosynthesis